MCLESRAAWFRRLAGHHQVGNVCRGARILERQKLLDLHSELNKDAGQFWFQYFRRSRHSFQLNAGFQEETMRRFVLIISDR